MTDRRVALERRERHRRANTHRSVSHRVNPLQLADSANVDNRRRITQPFVDFDEEVRTAPHRDGARRAERRDGAIEALGSEVSEIAHGVITS